MNAALSPLHSLPRRAGAEAARAAALAELFWGAFGPNDDAEADAARDQLRREGYEVEWFGPVLGWSIAMPGPGGAPHSPPAAAG